MKEIALYPLRHGRVAKVDDADVALVSQYRWHAAVRRRPSGAVLNVYAIADVRTDEKKTTILMHRLIAAAGPDEQVDHEDSDGLNNQRTNLRKCTQRQNSRNMRDRPGSSSLKGVSWHALEGRWRATIKLESGQRHLGLYDNEEDAARVYDNAAREMFGAFARTNFSDASDVTSTRRRKSSAYRGVSFLPKAQKKPWLAFMKVGKRVVKLGTFVEECDAANAYDAAARAHFGDKARLNAIAGGARLKPPAPAAQDARP